MEGGLKPNLLSCFVFSPLFRQPWFEEPGAGAGLRVPEDAPCLHRSGRVQSLALSSLSPPDLCPSLSDAAGACNKERGRGIGAAVAMTGWKLVQPISLLQHGEIVVIALAPSWFYLR